MSDTNIPANIASVQKRKYFAGGKNFHLNNNTDTSNSQKKIKRRIR